jgi:hypothetical protein
MKKPWLKKDEYDNEVKFHIHTTKTVRAYLAFMAQVNIDRLEVFYTGNKLHILFVWYDKMYRINTDCYAIYMLDRHKLNEIVRAINEITQQPIYYIGTSHDPEYPEIICSAQHILPSVCGTDVCWMKVDNKWEIAE